MSEPETNEEHAALIYQIVCYALGHNMSHNRGRERVREYLEQHFHVASKCRNTDCCLEDEDAP